MTKERTKYLIENIEIILGELENGLNNAIESGKQIDFPDDLNTENLNELYKIYEENCKDIYEKYNIDNESFNLMIAISNPNDRKNVLGKEKEIELFKNTIDSYGKDAYDILSLDYYTFEISDIEDILVENKPEYNEFYKFVLEHKTRETINLQEFMGVLKNTRQDYITEDLFNTFGESKDKIIIYEEIPNFLEQLPDKIDKGKVVKSLVEAGNYKTNLSIIDMVPKELFDKEFSQRLLENNEDDFLSVFFRISDEVKDKEMWDYAIAKDSDAVYQLPENKIDQNMTDEEYKNLCDKLVGDKIDENPENIKNIYKRLADHLKSEKITTKSAKIIEIDDYESEIVDFLNEIPQKNKSREIYEILVEKTDEIIKEIPNETFENGVSQEEYNNWLENILENKIKNTENIVNLYFDIPREKRTEKIWNTVIDKLNQEKSEGKKIDETIFSLKTVPVQNITKDMSIRSLKEINEIDLVNIPIVDKVLEDIKTKEDRKEYDEWLSKFSENDKEEYRKWYEKLAIKEIKKSKPGENVFPESFEVSTYKRKCIPKEAITFNMIKTYLNINSRANNLNSLKKIPLPDENTKYKEQYKDIIRYAIEIRQSRGEQKKEVQHIDADILETIPKEYLTEDIIMAALRKNQMYLKYIDFEDEKSDMYLQTAFKESLESMGRTELTDKEIQTLKRMHKNNSTLFNTMDLKMISPEMLNYISERSIEKIVRYPATQNKILELSKDENKLATFGLTLDYLGQDIKVVEPLIEKISKKVEFPNRNDKFFEVVKKRVDFQNQTELKEEEKAIISYLTLNTREADKIQNNYDIVSFEDKQNKRLDKKMNSEDLTLVESKEAYLKRIVGMNYNKVVQLINKYGNEPENLLKKYEEKELETFKEKSEKESLEIIIKLKSLIQENNIDNIKQAYNEAIQIENEKSYLKYKNEVVLENTLKRSYGRDITESVTNHEKENYEETVEQTENGQEYTVRKLNGPFNRMVSVMNAYNKSKADDDADMYDRWNTSEMAETHALCYSYINASNPGTALMGDNKGIIIGMSGFDAEAIVAAAPYDLISNSTDNTTRTKRPEKYYTAEEFPNQTRGRYSEFVIELQDYSKDGVEYKKIQPTSIICFEEIDEESIKAAISLGDKLGKKIPIELIDRRELAKQSKEEIEEIYIQFKEDKELKPELVEQLLTKYNNVRNAHRSSNLEEEMLGEKTENSNAMFSKDELNNMLSECIKVTKQKIEQGQEKEGLEALENIKTYIRQERDKNQLMPTMDEKYYMAGIDIEIDQQIDSIQKEYNRKEITSKNENESLEILKDKKEITSKTFKAENMDSANLPEQISVPELREMIGIEHIEKISNEIHKKGYYKENKMFSEEHITRVAMYSDAIAQMEGIDDKTKTLLEETAKYYSSGRVIDLLTENHKEYTKSIIEKELENKYEKRDIEIIKSVIELNNSKNGLVANDQTKLDEIEKENNFDIEEMKQIKTIEKCLSDAICLDNIRFVEERKNKKFKDGIKKDYFGYGKLETESAKKLIKASYDIQDEISTRHIKEIVKVVPTNETYESPIEQELALKTQYKEIDLLKVAKEMSKAKEQSKETIKEKTKPENKILFTVQQIGKSTINIPTQQKDKAKEQLVKDVKELEEQKTAQYR